ncbi:hypothetical protein BC829DRAFT_382992 [Chytridium lagenaria]|nr:hypothetical protein BC829DRAFT_382992 [Chytridium lagenaria]
MAEVIIDPPTTAGALRFGSLERAVMRDKFPAPPPKEEPLEPIKPTAKPIKDSVRTLQSLYPDFFNIESPHIRDIEVRKVPTTPSQPRFPLVFFPPAADVQSEMGSVVEGTQGASGASSIVSDMSFEEEMEVEGLPEGVEMLIALYPFIARSDKEMSLVKGDVMAVHKRHQTWIYATKLRKLPRKSRRDLTADETTGGEAGWIPAAFVTKY